MVVVLKAADGGGSGDRRGDKRGAIGSEKLADGGGVCGDRWQ